MKATADLQQALFWESVDTVATILNAGQREMLPFVKGMFAVPLDQRKTSSFGFSPRVELFDKPTVRR